MCLTELKSPKTVSKNLICKIVFFIAIHIWYALLAYVRLTIFMLNYTSTLINTLFIVVDNLTINH